MVILGLVIFEAILAPLCLGIARLAQASCPERRRDLILALSCLGVLFLGIGIAVVVPSSNAAIWETLFTPVVIATMGMEIGILFISLNLLLIDHVTGRWEMAVRSSFGGSSERIQERLPFYTLRTPLSALRERRSRHARRAD